MTIPDLIDIALHFDKHLSEFVSANGALTYALLGGIVFAETGLVVLPFLPGDSLLFAAGALCAPNINGVHDKLLWEELVPVIFLAAFCGDNLNYAVGRLLGPRVLRGESGRWLSKKNLDRTHAFFETHGGKAVTLARFLPIIRTFAPFVAGVGGMRYTRFLAYSLLGTTLWAGVCVGAGFFFGNIPIVQRNFRFVVLGIIVVSLIPVAVEVVRARMAMARDAREKSVS